MVWIIVNLVAHIFSVVGRTFTTFTPALRWRDITSDTFLSPPFRFIFTKYETQNPKKTSTKYEWNKYKIWIAQVQIYVSLSSFSFHIHKIWNTKSKNTSTKYEWNEYKIWITQVQIHISLSSFSFNIHEIWNTILWLFLLQNPNNTNTKYSCYNFNYQNYRFHDC